MEPTLVKLQRTPWIERKFEFDLSPGWIYNILERLNGTGVRLRELTAVVPDEIASMKAGKGWSIKEHIGHLTDLEELHLGRLNDFILREPVLRAADMSNRKTEEAKHNQKSLGLLISEFIAIRNRLVFNFEKLDEETQHHRALHPRLNVHMRPVDMAFFTAEHDDHHLASIRMLKKEIVFK